MEGPTLASRPPFAHHHEYYHPELSPLKYPRLPTPDNSRSSNDAFDHSPVPKAHLARELLQPSCGIQRSGVVGIPSGLEHPQCEARTSHGQGSPPYRTAVAPKPSLPPLKSVLGDKINSPPRTPSPGHNISQPVPREPSYTTAAYMPPSLYPNKKPRTDPFLTSVQQRNAITTHPSEKPFSNLVSRTETRFPPFPTTLNGLETRRGSNSTHSPPWASQFSSQQSKPINHRTGSDTTAYHYRTPDHTPTAAVHEPTFPRVSMGSIRDPFASDAHDSTVHPRDRPSTRRASTTGYGTYVPHPYGPEVHQAYPYERGLSCTMSTRDSCPEERLPDHFGQCDDHSRPESHFGQVPYQPNVPAFFMPSHYEYQHGKSRKRSNLPKQSTEIMKTWFDQNITNPYPSEEQKAVFSNATGISMTQVSNWFINHRRRCPELRDKREKNRNSGDGDM